MSLEKSVERLENSQTDVEFHWWDGEDFVEICDLIEAEGAENVTVEAYHGLKKNGLPEVWFKVVRKSDGSACGEINKSHPCPPICE